MAIKLKIESTYIFRDDDLRRAWMGKQLADTALPKGARLVFQNWDDYGMATFSDTGTLFSSPRTWTVYPHEKQHNGSIHLRIVWLCDIDNVNEVIEFLRESNEGFTPAIVAKLVERLMDKRTAQYSTEVKHCMIHTVVSYYELTVAPEPEQIGLLP